MAAATPLIMPPLGLDHVARFSYDEGPGLTTLTAKAKAKDWHGVIDAAGVLLDDLGIRRPSLDDVFLTLTGRAADNAAENQKEVA